MNEFELAIVHADTWEWQVGLASCHSKLGQYDQAIEWGSKSLSATDNEFRVATLSDIATWCLLLSKPDVPMAIQTSREAHELSPVDIRPIATYLKALFAGQRFQEMVDLIEEIVNANRANPQSSLLTDVSHIYPNFKTKLTHQPVFTITCPCYYWCCST